MMNESYNNENNDKDIHVKYIIPFIYILSVDGMKILLELRLFN